MKKLKFRKWVQYLLIIIFIIAFIICCSDCEDTNVYVISHAIAIAVIIADEYLLVKYTDIFKN